MSRNRVRIFGLHDVTSRLLFPPWQSDTLLLDTKMKTFALFRTSLCQNHFLPSILLICDTFFEIFSGVRDHFSNVWTTYVRFCLSSQNVFTLQITNLTVIRCYRCYVTVQPWSQNNTVSKKRDSTLVSFFFMMQDNSEVKWLHVLKVPMHWNKTLMPELM